MRIRIQPLSIPQDSCEAQLKALIEENYVKHSVAYGDKELLYLLFDLTILYSSQAATKKGTRNCVLLVWSIQIPLRNWSTQKTCVYGSPYELPYSHEWGSTGLLTKA